MMDQPVDEDEDFGGLMVRTPATPILNSKILSHVTISRHTVYFKGVPKEKRRQKGQKEEGYGCILRRWSSSW